MYGYGDGHYKRSQVEAQIRFPQQRSVVGYSDVDVGEGNDWILLLAHGQPRKEDVTVSPLSTMRQAAARRTENGRGAMTKKPTDLDPLVLERPAEDKTLMLEMRGDRKNDGGVGQWQCQAEDVGKYHRGSLARTMESWSESTTTCGRLGRVTSFVNTTKKPIHGQRKASGGYCERCLV